MLFVTNLSTKIVFVILFRYFKYWLMLFILYFLLFFFSWFFVLLFFSNF